MLRPRLPISHPSKAMIPTLGEVGSHFLKPRSLKQTQPFPQLRPPQGHMPSLPDLCWVIENSGYLETQHVGAGRTTGATPPFTAEEAEARM